MATISTYRLGGFSAAAPNGNLAERWSNGTQAGEPASGYTAWDAQGVVTLQRALTAQETATLAAQDTATTTAVNQSTLQQKAQAALTTNTTYLAIGSPSNAQVATQVQALTKECSAVIRLLLNQLDSTSGT